MMSHKQTHSHVPVTPSFFPQSSIQEANAHFPPDDEERTRGRDVSERQLGLQALKQTVEQHIRREGEEARHETRADRASNLTHTHPFD
jgi:hypothetical protein